MDVVLHLACTFVFASGLHRGRSIGSTTPTKKMHYYHNHGSVGWGSSVLRRAAVGLALVFVYLIGETMDAVFQVEKRSLYTT